MALQLKGVILPSNEERALFLDGDRITFDPVARAQTIAASDLVWTALGNPFPGNPELLLAFKSAPECSASTTGE